jgi:hypothetical protein
LNLDTPVSALNNYLLSATHSLAAARVTLVLATVLLTVLFFEATVFLPRAVLASGFALLTLAALPAETSYAFVRLFRVNGTSGRPLTLAQGAVFDWVDRNALSPDAHVTMIPYPTVLGDYWSSVAYWWDLEFWNKSVDHAAYYPKQYEGTPSTFPKLYLSFDPRTGVTNHSPTVYVAQSAKETRFRIAGKVGYANRDVLLIDAGEQWHADWVSYGLYDDGWTRPGKVARVRVFAVPRQRRPVTRTLTLGFQTPVGVRTRAFSVSSNAALWHGRATQGPTAIGSIKLCVPARGWSEVHIRVNGESPVYGDMRDYSTYLMLRRGGLLLTEIALADEIGRACAPGAAATG